MTEPTGTLREALEGLATSWEHDVVSDGFMGEKETHRTSICHRCQIEGVLSSHRDAQAPQGRERAKGEFAKHAPKFNSKTGQVSCRCGASLSFVSSVGPHAKESLIEAVAYQYGTHLFWLAADSTPSSPAQSGLPQTGRDNQGERERLAEAFHTSGHCGYDHGTWAQIKTHGIECQCFETADIALIALAQPSTPGSERE